MSPAEIAAATGGTVTERAIAILVAAGVTSNRAIAGALGITARAVQKARKATHGRTTVREPQFADANHSSPKSEPQFASGAPPPPKRKVSPCTPSKENTPPPPPAVDRESQNNSAATRESHARAAADDFDKCRPIITALVRALYPPTNFPHPPRAGVEKFIRAALETGHSVGQVREAANILIAKAIDDDEIRKPGVLFSRIIGDVRREGGRKKPTIPAGAIDLGDGQYLSRW